MKKLSFPLIVILLMSIIITLIGYNSLTIHQNSQKYQEAKDQNQSTQTVSTSQKPMIYCIGDSLTFGSGSSSYPNALASLVGDDYNVTKFGGEQDQTIDIAVRMGKVKVYVHDITIPSKSQPVNVQLYDEDHEKLDILKGKGSSFEEVSIQGIQGQLKYDSESKTHTFTRHEDGKKVTIDQYTQVKSDFPTFEKNSIAIIFTGTYDPNISNGIFRTITYQRSIISQLKTKKYIVVSLTSKRAFPIVNDMNAVLKEEHQEHFLDFRNYLLQDGLKDANVTPTSQDRSDLEKGYIPSSLLQDNKRDGNSHFNELLAQQILEKMIELKYIDQKA